jgi:hypothetical protein
MAEKHLNHTEENWKTIEDFPNYEVSNLGRIRRLTGRLSGHIISQIPNRPGGYLHVVLYNKKYKSRYVHRLVATAFHGNCPAQHECNHIDGIRTNNRADNLEWVTSKKNKTHAIEMGLMNNKGSRHGVAKLTEEQVCAIKKALASGATLASLATQYGVCFQAISQIKRGKTWTHV